MSVTRKHAGSWAGFSVCGLQYARTEVAVAKIFDSTWSRTPPSSISFTASSISLRYPLIEFLFLIIECKNPFLSRHDN